jgi:hypothetical protein
LELKKDEQLHNNNKVNNVFRRFFRNEQRHSSSSSQSSSSSNEIINEAAYQRRKDEWAAKYTSVDALRETFGSNRNTLWGDLDAATTRRLYKTLLPKALLELYNLGVHAEDLAPLAYRARVAAKLYARERCNLPARVAANLYDGFRQWRKYGSFDTNGMSYQQIWEKYSKIILAECQGEEGLTEDDVAAKICLKILERSCCTNEMVDKLVLSKRSEEDQKDLQHFTNTLEKDVRNLLQPVEMARNKASFSEAQLSAQRIKALKRLVKFKRRLEALQKKGRRQRGWSCVQRRCAALASQGEQDCQSTCSMARTSSAKA